MMRVCHVIGPLRTGGAQTQLLGLVRAAHGRSWDATVVATSGGALSPEFQRLGCPFVELRRRGSPGFLRIRALRKIVRSGNFDVVHGNLWQSNAYARLAVIGRADRPAMVISERNVEASRSVGRRMVDRLLANATDAYVGNTEAVTRFIAQVHDTNEAWVETIPNAVDSAIFYPRRGPRRPGPIRIGAIGRLDPEKGFDVLIEAVRQLHGVLDLELRIVGEGPSRPTLEHAAEGLPVTLVGSLTPGPPVADFLRGLDVFVLSSVFREGRPNVVLEAIACHVPVVATDISGMDELLSFEILTPPGDAAALAAALARAANDPADWIRRGQPSPVRSFEDLANEYDELFRRVRRST